MLVFCVPRPCPAHPLQRLPFCTLHFSGFFALVSRLVSVDARRASCVERSSLPARSFERFSPAVPSPLLPPRHRALCASFPVCASSSASSVAHSFRLFNVLLRPSIATPAACACASLALSRPSRSPCASLRLVLPLPPTAVPLAALLSIHFPFAPCLHPPRSCVLCTPLRCSLSSSRCAPLRPPTAAPPSPLLAPCSPPLLVSLSFSHLRAPSPSSPSFAAPPLRTAHPASSLFARALPPPAAPSLRVSLPVLSPAFSAAPCPVRHVRVCLPASLSLSLSAPVAARFAPR